MDCKYCGKGIKNDFSFCPYCGKRVKRNIFDNMFGHIFKSMEHDAFEEPFFKFEPMDGAITIKVTGGREPEIETSGDYKRYEPEIKKRIRVVPKQKAEPETKVEDDDGVRRFRMKMPGVKSMQDVDIMEFPESIEIRGYAGDKLFFKLIPLPEESRLINKKLNKGILEIELAI